MQGRRNRSHRRRRVQEVRRRRPGERGRRGPCRWSEGLLLRRLLGLGGLLGLLGGLGLTAMVSQDLDGVFLRGVFIPTSPLHPADRACLAPDHINGPTQLPVGRRPSLHSSSHQSQEVCFELCFDDVVFHFFFSIACSSLLNRDLVLSADGRSRVQPQLKPPLLFTISFPCFFIESIIKVIRKISTWLPPRFVFK